jgi:hypothetical protein
MEYILLIFISLVGGVFQFFLGGFIGCFVLGLFNSKFDNTSKNYDNLKYKFYFKIFGGIYLLSIFLIVIYKNM